MATTLTNSAIVLSDTAEAQYADAWWDQFLTYAAYMDGNLVTATKNKSFADKDVSRANLKDCSVEVNAIGNTSGAVAVDYEDGNTQTLTLTGNATSLTISNWPASGDEGVLKLYITQDGTGSRTLSLSSAYKTPGGSGVTLSTGAADVDVLVFTTLDGGTTVYVDHALNYS